MTLKLPCGRRAEHFHTFSWGRSEIDPGMPANSIRARHDVVEFWLQFAYRQALDAENLHLDGVPVDGQALQRTEGWNPVSFLQYHRDAGHELAVRLMSALEERWTKW